MELISRILTIKRPISFCTIYELDDRKHFLPLIAFTASLFWLFVKNNCVLLFTSHANQKHNIFYLSWLLCCPHRADVGKRWSRWIKSEGFGTYENISSTGQRRGIEGGWVLLNVSINWFLEFFMCPENKYFIVYRIFLFQSQY